MTGIEYLDPEDLLALVRQLEFGSVRDVCLLNSAAARPRSSAFGEDSYPTLDLKAAALLQSVAVNHALIDGNKRLAWLAAVIFLDLNPPCAGDRRRGRLRPGDERRPAAGGG